ncbi:MAG TPA: hypothetical protein VN222_07530 [Novosphingobium sp.]|nr:hypothetical protein [Novosphingobium sp.]
MRPAFLLLLPGLLLATTLRAAPAQDITIQDTAVFPESMDIDPAGRLYVGSMKGVIYRALPGSAQATAWIRPDERNRLLWVLGIVADAPARTLWACTSPALFLDPPKTGEAALVAFDLESGALRARYPLPGEKAVCNDIAIVPAGQRGAGTAFLTDTGTGAIYALAPGAQAPASFAQDKALVGVDGIAFGGDGALYVNNVRDNTMLRVDRGPDGAFAGLTRLALSRAVSGPDGLRPLGGNRFLQAEGPGGRVAEVTIAGDTAQLRDIETSIAGSPAVTHAHGIMYTFSGKIDYLFNPALKGKDPGAFVIRAIPLGGGQ